MERYVLKWRRTDLKDDSWYDATPKPVPFWVCIVIAKMITRGSNGPTQVVIRDVFKENAK